MDFDIPRSIASILLVGHAGIGKRRLASFILTETNSSVDINNNKEPQSKNASMLSNNSLLIRTIEIFPTDLTVLRSFDAQSTIALNGKDTNTTSTPTSQPTSSSKSTTAVESVNRYDLILLMVDMTDKGSWGGCQQALSKMDSGWLLGRCAIVITRVAAVSKYAFDRDEITDFLDTLCEVPRIWANLEQESECALAAAQVVRMLEIGGTYRPSRTARRGGGGGGGSFSSSSPSLATPTPTTAISPPTAAALSSSRLYGSTLSLRTMASHLMMRTPDKYNVENTSLSDTEIRQNHVQEQEQQGNAPNQ